VRSAVGYYNQALALLEPDDYGGVTGELLPQREPGKSKEEQEAEWLQWCAPPRPL